MRQVRVFHSVLALRSFMVLLTVGVLLHYCILTLKTACLPPALPAPHHAPSRTPNIACIAPVLEDYPQHGMLTPNIACLPPTWHAYPQYRMLTLDMACLHPKLYAISKVNFVISALLIAFLSLHGLGLAVTVYIAV